MNSELNQIPDSPHWAIISSDSFWIEGDERSRTNPGHGYPGHTETTISYQAFTDEGEWMQEVIRLSTPTQFGGRTVTPKAFKAVKVIPATIKTKVYVEVE